MPPQLSRHRARRDGRASPLSESGVRLQIVVRYLVLLAAMASVVVSGIAFWVMSGR